MANNSKHISRMVEAMKNWDIVPSGKVEAPSGVFGRKVIIKSGDVKIDSDELDCEFSVPFDDNTEPNEAEITVYNLTQTTIKKLKNDQTISITAGYGKDTGVIFSGRISKVKTKYVGVDKQTTIYAVDSESRKDMDIEAVTYGSQAKASTILKHLVLRLKLPIAVFKVRYDKVFESPVTISGSLNSNIENYANICGVSVYINKGMVYVRQVSKGSDINFTVSEETGLIDTPEEFEEEHERESGEETITETTKGYKLKMLLQHRITVGVTITLKSRNANGRFTVREGSHSFDGTNFTTEITVVS